MKRFLFASIACSLLLLGCNNSNNKNGETYLPPSVGQINTLAVVIDNDLWEGAVGDTIRRYFAAPIDGLPTEEPIFSLHQVPPQVFEGNTRNSRNVLIVHRGNKNEATISDDVYAKPQVVCEVQGKQVRDIACKVEEFHDQFILAFKNNDLKETRHRFNNALSKDKQVEQTLGFKFVMPAVYQVRKYGDNFFWIERPIKGGRASIILYEMPFGSIPADEEGRAKTIVKMRDSIGKKYIPGPKEGMYMVTETYLAPSISEMKIKGRKTIESKGLWEVKDFALGGPYINYIIEDKAHNRLVVAEGFLYAPGVAKRDMLFELEAIIKSIEFSR